jgi:hypothetical protein
MLGVSHWSPCSYSFDEITGYSRQSKVQGDRPRHLKRVLQSSGLEKEPDKSCCNRSLIGRLNVVGLERWAYQLTAATTSSQMQSL